MIDFRLGEPSTKRGIVRASASVTALLQILSTASSPWEVLANPVFWVAVGGLISGIIGMFVSDAPGS